jgi:hypothetical protein
MLTVSAVSTCYLSPHFVDMSLFFVAVNIGVSGRVSMKNSIQDAGLLQRHRNTAMNDRRLQEI